jgi:predicted nucleotidyltransferase
MRDVDEAGVEAIARKHHARLILQFGSTVSGKTHPRSDIDIAVLLERPHMTLREHAELLHDLQSLSEAREVDLVILNRADPLLLKQVSDRCVRLYGTDAELHRFRLLAFKRYQDHRRYLEMERRFVERALERDVPRS